LGLIALCLLFSVEVQAQATPQFENMLVELWPEYDRPEVLMIYRAELKSTTALPVQLTFRLPGYIGEMNAVAVERDGVLVDVDPEVIEQRREGDDLILTFPATSPRIQFEYYDPVILTRQNQTRQLAFQFSAPYSVEVVTFEVQEPLQAENFSLTPAPNDTFTGRDGLKYHTIQVADLAPADTFELTATYQRATTELSAQQLARNAPSQPSNISVITEPSAGESFNLGSVLIGGGVLLLLIGGGYWWLSQRQTEPARLPRRTARPKRRTKAKPARRGAGDNPTEHDEPKSATTGGFCYRCGTALRDDANFCHNCGAERRTA
jgi:hypothetical protein